MTKDSTIVCSLAGFIIFEYYQMYINRELYNWGNPKSGAFQHNPIIKGAIVEPMNAFSSFIYVIYMFKYKNNIFNLLQQLTVVNLALGSFFYHGSVTRYGLYLDYDAINSYLINLVSKDYYIMKIITNPDTIKKTLPYCFLFNRLVINTLIKKSIMNYNPLYIMQMNIFDILLSAKVIDEIVKLNNNNRNKSLPYFLIWFFGFVYKTHLEKKTYLNWEKNVYLKWKKKYYTIQDFKTNKITMEHPIIDRGTANPFIIYSKYIFQFVYFLCIVNASKSKKQIDKLYLCIALPLALGSLAFYGEYSKCCRTKPCKVKASKSIMQMHTIWHILSGLGFYFYDGKYLLANVENVSTNSKVNTNEKRNISKPMMIGSLFLTVTVLFFLKKYYTKSNITKKRNFPLKKNNCNKCILPCF